MKFIKTAFLALIITSCAPIYVNYDYEKGTDFSQYKTYNYYSDMNTGLSELDTKRLLDALDLKLAAAQRETVGVGVGGGGANVGGGISIGLPIGQANINRQITIDFVDENKKQLFWQAVSESTFNPTATPEKRETKLTAVVEKVLTKYPPKK